MESVFVQLEMVKIHSEGLALCKRGQMQDKSLESLVL